MNKEFPAILTLPEKKKDFAAYIAGLTAARITGIFPEKQDAQLQFEKRNMRNGQVIATAGEGDGKFVQACCGKCQAKQQQAARPCHSNPEDRQLAAILKESRFSDLLILGAQRPSGTGSTSDQAEHTKTVLTKSECPVMIAPSTFESIDEIIYPYDGSYAAVYAIRQFTQLFPGLTDKKLTIVQVNSRKEGVADDRKDILALLQTHYSSIGFRVLTGNAVDVLPDYLLEKKNAVVILGAFASLFPLFPYRQRTTVFSGKALDLPLFAAHLHHGDYH